MSQTETKHSCYLANHLIDFPLYFYTGWKSSWEIINRLFCKDFYFQWTVTVRLNIISACIISNIKLSLFYTVNCSVVMQCQLVVLPNSRELQISASWFSFFSKIKEIMEKWLVSAEKSLHKDELKEIWEVMKMFSVCQLLWNQVEMRTRDLWKLKPFGKILTCCLTCSILFTTCHQTTFSSFMSVPNSAPYKQVVGGARRCRKVKRLSRMYRLGR